MPAVLVVGVVVVVVSNLPNPPELSTKRMQTLLRCGTTENNRKHQFSVATLAPSKRLMEVVVMVVVVVVVVVCSSVVFVFGANHLRLACSRRGDLERGVTSKLHWIAVRGQVCGSVRAQLLAER